MEYEIKFKTENKEECVVLIRNEEAFIGFLKDKSDEFYNIPDIDENIEVLCEALINYHNNSQNEEEKKKLLEIFWNKYKNKDNFVEKINKRLEEKGFDVGIYDKVEDIKNKADNGDKKAINEYFQMIVDKVITVSKEEKIKYYKMAADNGNIEAMNSYAVILFGEDETNIDKKEIFKLIETKFVNACSKKNEDNIRDLYRIMINFNSPEISNDMKLKIIRDNLKKACENRSNSTIEVLFDEMGKGIINDVFTDDEEFNIMENSFKYTYYNHNYGTACVIFDKIINFKGINDDKNQKLNVLKECFEFACKNENIETIELLISKIIEFKEKITNDEKFYIIKDGFKCLYERKIFYKDDGEEGNRKEYLENCDYNLNKLFDTINNFEEEEIPIDEKSTLLRNGFDCICQNKDKYMASIFLMKELEHDGKLEKNGKSKYKDLSKIFEILKGKISNINIENLSKDDMKYLYYYALILYYGCGVDKNMAEVVKYFEILLDKGNDIVMFKYAEILEKGDGVKQDLKKAEEYYKKLADKGNYLAKIKYQEILKNTNNLKSNANNLEKPKSLFTYGITTHDAMPAYKFRKSLDSVIESYKYMNPKKPINIIISIDSESEEEFLKRLEEREEKISNNEKEFELMRFRSEKENKRKYIEEIKQKIKKENLDINFSVIESSKRFGKVSDSRNKIIDLCKTKYLSFLDGDDEIELEGLQRYQNECNNNELGNKEGRKDFANDEKIITGEADVIYLENRSQRAVWGNIYNVETLRNKKIKFTNLIGSEDGFIKAALLQNNLKIVFAAEENIGISFSRYKASNSTILDEEKIFETIIQLTNHLARHNKYGMKILQDSEGKEEIKTYYYDLLYDNIFHYFSRGNRFLNNGYGTFFRSHNDEATLYLESLYDSEDTREENRKRYLGIISTIICSLILYPEVLSDEKEREYFIKVRETLIEKIRNKEKNISIIKILRETEGFSDIYRNIEGNFYAVDKDEKNIFEGEYFNKIDEYLINEKKQEMFFKTLSELKIDSNTKEIKKIKNPHLTGDSSAISEIIDFNEYFSATELKNEKEENVIYKMNKLLNGKYIPKEFLILDENEKKEILKDRDKIREFAIRYLFALNRNEDKEYIYNIIKKTAKYNKKNEKGEQKIKNLVDKECGIKNLQSDIYDLNMSKIDILAQNSSMNCELYNLQVKKERANTFDITKLTDLFEDGILEYKKERGEENDNESKDESKEFFIKK